MANLQIGTVIKSNLGVDITIKGELGHGGQGTVYRVDYSGEEKALKWYHSAYIQKLYFKNNNNDKSIVSKGDKNYAIEFYNNLKNNVEAGSPSSNFLWPEDLTPWNCNPDSQFGYIMPIRPDGYKVATAYYMENIENAKSLFKSDRILYTACINIIDAFRTLHNNGYSYQDVNNGNFFINQDNGDVLICDNDNVSTNGVNFGIGGKQRYMAPEVVLGSCPNKFSDRFSLAIVLFRLLFFSQHPFEGKYSTPPCMTPEYERKFFGEDPVFLFDPDDNRNAPVDYLNQAAMLLWPLVPSYIQNLFIRTFNKDGIKNPENRPVDLEWLEAFITLKGSCVPCPQCGKPNILEVGKKVQCYNCQREISSPIIVKTPNITLPIAPGTYIPEYVIDSSIDKIGSDLGAIIKSNKTGKIGFGNLTERTLSAQYPDGSTQEVAPKSVVPFQVDMTILSGNKKIQFIKNN